MTGDCDAVRDIETGHKYAKTAAEAGAMAIKAGLDNDCTVVFGPDAGPPDTRSTSTRCGRACWPRPRSTSP